MVAVFLLKASLCASELLALVSCCPSVTVSVCVSLCGCAGVAVASLSTAVPTPVSSGTGLIVVPAHTPPQAPGAPTVRELGSSGLCLTHG